MIDCSFIKNDDWWHSLGTYSKPNHHFLRKFSFLLYATPFISFDSADCPYAIILGIVDPIYVKVSRPRTESSSCPLFENVFVPSSKTFFFSLYVRRLVVHGSTIFLYGRRSRSFFNIRRTLVREIFSSRANFALVTFFFRFKRCFTFLIDSFVRMVRERPGDVDSSIEPVSRIMLHHRLTVRRHNAPFKCRNISNEPSPFPYFESTGFCKSLLFIVGEKN